MANRAESSRIREQSVIGLCRITFQLHSLSQNGECQSQQTYPMALKSAVSMSLSSNDRWHHRRQHRHRQPRKMHRRSEVNFPKDIQMSLWVSRQIGVWTVKIGIIKKMRIRVWVNVCYYNLSRNVKSSMLSVMLWESLKVKRETCTIFRGRHHYLEQPKQLIKSVCLCLVSVR